MSHDEIATTGRTSRVEARTVPPLRGISRIGLGSGSGERLAGALESVFNIVALNLVLLVACVPVVTAPLAVRAACVALDRWRVDGETRVVREFLAALRTGSLRRGTVTFGVPLAAGALGILELRHFARLGGVVGDSLCGLGLSALLLTALGLGYLFVFAVHCTLEPPIELWSLAVRYGVRTLAFTGPLFLVEIVAGAMVCLIDPALVLAGVPALVLLAVLATARRGIRHLDDRLGR